MKTNKVAELHIIEADNSIFKSVKYCIPLYQRDYAWEEKQIIQLIEDIDDVNLGENYYIGSLIVACHDGLYEVVDGQQRLTTLFLLLSYLGLNTGNEEALFFSCRDKSNYTLRHIKQILADERDKYDAEHLQQNIISGLNIIKENIEKFTDEHLHMGHITLKLYCISNALSTENGIYDFNKLCIIDNGIGLNDTSYERLINLRDDSKHFSNKGTGRIQYIHTFDETTLESIYKDNNDTFFKRKVTLSKKPAFISQNAIMRLDEEVKVSDKDTNTIVTFLKPLETNDTYYFQTLKIDVLKEEIIKHFLSLFCDNRTNLPHIEFSCYINQIEEDRLDIQTEDIPEPNKEETFSILYSQLGESNKIVHSTNSEVFTLKAFVQPEANLKENAIYLVSKGERASSIKLDNLASKDSIAGKRYLFLLSSTYIDNKDRDDRGNIQLITSKDFRAQEEGNLFPEETILLEDIQGETNKKIGTLYAEITETTQEKNKTIDELQQMFLLNPTTVNKIRRKIKNTDSEETILKAIYQADSEIEAQKDDIIRKQLEELKALTPDKTDDYHKQLQERVNELVTSIPMQNRTVLSKYVARRKLVLDLFDEILNRELDALKNGKRIDEKLLHNLLFQQGASSENPDDSDLWIINDDFIYFRGVSEEKFEDIEYNGKKIFENQFKLGIRLNTVRLAREDEVYPTMSATFEGICDFEGKKFMKLKIADSIFYVEGEGTEETQLVALDFDNMPVYDNEGNLLFD